ncbi:rRNA maturation RNase YbeY [Campylobacter sp. RM9344]|uniref:Endoribonuclease YbeY n=1 Tax=Campylobacter californiensis TaxID=1032243 RepID=A0AAW3ZWC3_9BACT|nr:MULTISPECIES: rRNA maturation RNase YbeY [unclassified Campylobacter]MBE2984725.1 rRNA maturation RNase YbeY [Campylobacter sp. RM6883]MBE2986915.1 rRNA maturation RNase YbeY [Campylobacter sp. RM12919]MBE2987797.1 rRNA maturation RNase YbeY [Campylobacter sp. RM12920]MBE2994641.1 rRNA maturation RNase YbeY [Campylobacter sp. RM6913]MBE3021505.1 rRNA maturation RNase YbeY [Campylobacter sp. 7477a]MBE3029167.1 rRNA maturation RNase YbeY [Campylobacter sp. RM9344]
MILCDEAYPQILDEICSYLTIGEVELSFVRSDEMREINLSQRNIDKTTDVLSFPFETVLHAPLGCIVINLDLVEQKATELGHGNDEETALLFTHGLLHVLGFDHEKDEGEMREKECEVIEKFNLPKSLIVRTMD